MATKKTTIKPIKLEYRDVESTGTYTELMGVAKGLSITQDTSDETLAEAEFYDSPFDIFYTGKPVKIAFDLTNFGLNELSALIGGTYTAAASGLQEGYEAATAVTSVEKEWKLSFQRGNEAIVIYRGKTQATLKMESGAPVAYSFTITSLVTSGSTLPANDGKLYKFLGDEALP